MSWFCHSDIIIRVSSLLVGNLFYRNYCIVRLHEWMSYITVLTEQNLTENYCRATEYRKYIIVVRALSDKFLLNIFLIINFAYFVMQERWLLAQPRCYSWMRYQRDWTVPPHSKSSNVSSRLCTWARPPSSCPSFSLPLRPSTYLMTSSYCQKAKLFTRDLANTFLSSLNPVDSAALSARVLQTFFRR